MQIDAGEDLYWFDHINRPLTSRDVYFFLEMLALVGGHVCKQFQCLRLSQEACGAPPRLVLLLNWAATYVSKGSFQKQNDVLKLRLASWSLFLTILGLAFFGNTFFETRASCIYEREYMTQTEKGIKTAILRVVFFSLANITKEKAERDNRKSNAMPY